MGGAPAICPQAFAGKRSLLVGQLFQDGASFAGFVEAAPNVKSDRNPPRRILGKNGKRIYDGDPGAEEFGGHGHDDAGTHARSSERFERRASNFTGKRKDPFGGFQNAGGAGVLARRP